MLIPPVLFAQEELGELKVKDFLLSPQGTIQEGQTGGFSIKNSFVTLQWQRDADLFAEMSFGSKDLVQSASWYKAPTSQNDLNLTEFWLQKTGRDLDIRFGLLPLKLGYEGFKGEAFWLLPASDVQDLGFVTKRDYGLQFSSYTRPFFTYFTIYNGESGANSDAKAWFSGLWGLETDRGFGWLLSGQVGELEPISTTGNLEPRLNFDPTVSAKLRIAQMSFYHESKNTLLLLEGLYGEFLQLDQEKPFSSWRFDGASSLTDDYKFLIRYQETKFDASLSNLWVTQGMGLRFEDTSNLSSLTLWAERRLEPEPAINDDLIKIIWQVQAKAF